MRGCKCNADQNVLLINNIRLNPFKNRVAFECELWAIFQNNGHNPFENRVTFEQISMIASILIFLSLNSFENRVMFELG